MAPLRRAMVCVASLGVAFAARLPAQAVTGGRGEATVKNSTQKIETGKEQASRPKSLVAGAYTYLSSLLPWAQIQSSSLSNELSEPKATVKTLTQKIETGKEQASQPKGWFSWFWPQSHHTPSNELPEPQKARQQRLNIVEEKLSARRNEGAPPRLSFKLHKLEENLDVQHKRDGIESPGANGGFESFFRDLRTIDGWVGGEKGEDDVEIMKLLDEITIEMDRNVQKDHEEIDKLSNLLFQMKVGLNQSAIQVGKELEGEVPEESMFQLGSKQEGADVEIQTEKEQDGRLEELKHGHGRRRCEEAADMLERLCDTRPGRLERLGHLQIKQIKRAEDQKTRRGFISHKRAEREKELQRCLADLETRSRPSGWYEEFLDYAMRINRLIGVGKGTDKVNDIKNLLHDLRTELEKVKTTASDQVTELRALLDEMKKEVEARSKTEEELEEDAKKGDPVVSEQIKEMEEDAENGTFSSFDEDKYVKHQHATPKKSLHKLQENTKTLIASTKEQTKKWLSDKQKKLKQGKDKLNKVKGSQELDNQELKNAKEFDNLKKDNRAHIKAKKTNDELLASSPDEDAALSEELHGYED